MNRYVTGATVKELREKRKLTQAELGEKIGVSSKTVSKWETGKGLPDISLLKPLAETLGISLIELVKLYPEGNAETRLQIRGRGNLYYYCNRHGLMKKAYKYQPSAHPHKAGKPHTGWDAAICQ